MAITAYKSSSKKRLFTNFPLRRGMYYGNLITFEGVCKASVNYDTSTSGEEGFPRPAFVNSILHNGFNSIYMPEHLIKQETNIGPTFLIGTNSIVNNDDFVNQAVGDACVISKFEAPFNLKIASIGRTVEQFVVDGSITRVHLASYGATVDDDPVIDGDTAYVYIDGQTNTERFKIRLVGIDTPEINQYNDRGTYNSGYSYDPGDVVKYNDYYYVCIASHATTKWPNSEPTYWTKLTDYGFEAKAALEAQLSAYDTYYIMYDEFSSKLDDNDRALVYLLGRNNLDTNHTLINAWMLLYGYGELAFIDQHYKLYDQIKLAYDTAVEYTMRIHGDVTTTPPEYTSLGPAIVLVDSADTTSDLSANKTYFKQAVWDNIIVNGTIYSTQGFFESSPQAYDIGLTGEDVTIQFLVHDHQSQEYEFVQKGKTIPHVNMPWRNAIGVLGRIIENNIVRYKGLIILQYGRINPEDDYQFYVLVQEPYEVNLGKFNNQDPYSIAYNALDDDPYVFVDYVGDDASSWIRPAVLGVTLYDNNVITGPQNCKILKSVNSSQRCQIKPWFALPDIIDTDYKGTYMRVLFDGEWQPLAAWPEGWMKIHSSDNTYEENTVSLNCRKIWDFSSMNGKPIEVHLKSIFEGSSADNEVVQGSVQGSSSYTFLNEEKVVRDDTITYSIRAENDIFVAPGTISYDRVTFTITNTVTGETKEASYMGYVWDSGELMYEFPANHTFSIDFEDWRFSFTMVGQEVLLDFNRTVDLSARYEEWLAFGNSPIMSVTGEEKIDSKDVLKEHNVWNATQLAIWDRFLIFYGESMGSHSLQFSEFDETDHLPFPYGQIVFASKIIHVHSHQGMLYVFCSDGLWILHGGVTYTELIKTFAYAGVSLDPAEKKSVVSFGNEIFFMNNNRGYVVRTNQYVESKDDVYVMEMTQPINSILGDPSKFVQERLQNAYEILVEDTSTLTVSYVSKVINSELHLIASYHIEDPLDILMVTYIYDRDRKAWRIYDTVAGSFPITTVSSSNIKGYDLVLANHYDGGFITYGTYLYELPNAEALGQRLGDARSVVLLNGSWEMADDDANVVESLQPIQTLLDSGALDISGMHKKRVRQFSFKFSNPNAVALEYKMVPFMDGIPFNNAVSVDAIIDEYGNVVEQLLQDNDQGDIETKDIVIVMVNELGGTSLIETKFTTLSRFELRIGTNLLGYSPGFQLYIPAKDTFHINQYGIRYRQFGAR